MLRRSYHASVANVVGVWVSLRKNKNKKQKNGVVAVSGFIKGVWVVTSPRVLVLKDQSAIKLSIGGPSISSP